MIEQIGKDTWKFTPDRPSCCADCECEVFDDEGDCINCESGERIFFIRNKQIK